MTEAKLRKSATNPDHIMTEAKLRKLVREELLREQDVIDSKYLQDTIATILEDWDELSGAEREVLEYIKHRLNQSFPGGDVSKDDIHTILNEPGAPNASRDPNVDVYELSNLVWMP